MDFFRIFFKEETIVGLSALGIKKKYKCAIPVSYENIFSNKNESIFKSNFEKNILLI